jgi:RimJ/RimL family protein N-acetyltransferase
LSPARKPSLTSRQAPALTARRTLEAARAATSFGFGELDLAEIVSFTTAANRRSRRVMERLGMTHDQADDFEHPQILGTPLAPHVLYRLRRAP